MLQMRHVRLTVIAFLENKYRYITIIGLVETL